MELKETIKKLKLELEQKNRELEIEVALEHLRAASMRMQKTNDLSDVVVVYFEQLKLLNIEFIQSWITIFHVEEGYVSVWFSPLRGIHKSPAHFKIPSALFENTSIKSWKAGEPFSYISMSSKDQVDQFMQICDEITDTNYFMTTQNKLKLERFEMLDANNKYGCISKSNIIEASEEEKAILLRFSKVFEQTYTRFLDLQKVEKQVKEAQIEAALEKVRTVALSLTSSEDMLDIAKVLYEQLFGLGFTHIRNAIIDVHVDDDNFIDYDYSAELKGTVTKMSYSDDPSLEEQFRQVVASKDELFELILEGNELQGLIDMRLKNGEAEDPRLLEIDQLTYYMYSFGNGAIGISNFGLLSSEEKAILKRFRNVFTFAYNRYSELAQKEAQAREVRLEAALEKVRSTALSLKKSDDMLEIAKELYVQLLGLGFDNIRNAIIDIHNDEDETFWDYDYSHEMSGTVTLMSYYDDPIIEEQVRQIESSNDAFFEIILEGQTLQDLIDVRRNNGEADDPRLLNIDQLSYNLYSFGNGAIGISNFGVLNNEEKDILKRFRNVFTFAYQRFIDLQEKEIRSQQLEEEKQRLEITLADLQETQQQLIQSEKMASLGELTAGIAHEIQNPLNFVNNFSEVSQELIAEMLEELNNGDMEEVKAIMDDVIQNLEKINHHGKRADGIVKGMLQHSRASGNKKEPTDINALADEYLRLAYHGLRAKDKSFNAALDTHFDDNIKTIKIVPQDIGRVVLNLITNAFYACNEKKKLQIDGYEPMVSVKTEKHKDRITISVKDNGNGITQKVLDKIFQPFFTTKPTGQGTGLGLSLSYDIIKAHGGSIDVNTKENEGTEFIISLPTNNNQ